MKKLNTALLGLMLIILSACGDRLDVGGLGVGNGAAPTHVSTQKQYPSPYGFTLAYNSVLHLDDQRGPQDVVFDNRDLVKPGEKMSSVHLTVAEKAPKLTALYADIATKHPDTKFFDVSFPGAKGVRGIVPDAEGAIRAYYYIITSANVLVEMKVEAFDDAQGKRLVAPIADSFYAQFKFHSRALKDQGWDKHTAYSYLSNWNDRQVVLDNGRYVLAKLALYEGGQYLLHYTEATKSGPGSMNFDETKDIERVRGTWSIKDGKLIIDGLAQGKPGREHVLAFPAEEKDVDSVYLTFTRDIRTGGLKGKTLRLVMTSTFSMGGNPLED
jgi:hypothetical protein